MTLVHPSYMAPRRVGGGGLGCRVGALASRPLLSELCFLFNVQQKKERNAMGLFEFAQSRQSPPRGRREESGSFECRGSLKKERGAVGVSVLCAVVAI
jgi:hypothetical protein